jgi:hypothetical protein
MEVEMPKRDFLWTEGEPPPEMRGRVLIGQDDAGEYRVVWTEAAGGWWIEGNTGRSRLPKRWRFRTPHVE